MTTNLTTKENSMADQTLADENGYKPQKKANFTSWQASNALTQSSLAVVEPYVPIFARSIGASAGEVGLIAGLFSLVNMSQLIWARLSTRFGKSRIFVFVGQLVSAFLFLPMIFLRTGQVAFLLVIRILQGLFTSAAVPTQANLMADHISEKERATKVTAFTRIGLVGVFVGVLVGGQLFTTVSKDLGMGDQTGYTVIFVLTSVLGMLGASLFYISVPDKQYITKMDPFTLVRNQGEVSPSQLGLRKTILAYGQKFRNFWMFTIFGVIFYFATFLTGPFFIILEIEYYGFSFFQAGLLSAISTVVQISVAILTNKLRLYDTFGRKLFLFAGTVLIFFTPIAVIIPHWFPSIPAFLWCVGVWVIIGVGWGLFNTVVAIFLLDIAHPRYRSTLIASYNTFVGLAMFMGPVVGGILIEITGEISTAFVLRAFVMIVGFVPLVFVKEPEITGVILRPVRNFFPNIFKVTSHGTSVTLAQGRPMRHRNKHWISSRFKKRIKQF